MASRIDQTFARLRAERRPGLVTYITAGDPDLPRSAEILRALDRSGADVLEVGVPFSDPLADGPVIQRAAERARAAGGSLRTVLALIESVRADIVAPIVVFSYANPLLRMGLEPFARAARSAGVDGVLVLDLPIEEADGFRETLAACDLDTIFLLSPTTTDARIRRAAELARGFLYGISRLGVTGARARVGTEARALVARIRAHTSLPVALGFGISRPEHVAEVTAYADAAVVGSALVSLIAEAGGSPGLIGRIEAYVGWLKGARAAASDDEHGRRDAADAAAQPTASPRRVPTLDDLRRDIDRLDEVIVRLLNERARVVCEIGRLKRTDGVPVYQPEREKQVIDHVRGIAGEGPLGPEVIVRLFERIIDEARRLERRGVNGDASPEASAADLGGNPE